MATCDNDMRDDGRGARMPHQADYPARFPVQEQTLEGGNGNMKRRNLKAEERHAAKAKVAMNIQAGWSEPLLPDHYLSQHCTS